VPQILTHFDNEGLRGVLRSYPERVTEIETSEGDIFTDLDTPEEYQQLKLRLGLP
jgi:CTP:molybdopterin cytidylyltransferase MocA